MDPYSAITYCRSKNMIIRNNGINHCWNKSRSMRGMPPSCVKI